MEERAVIEKLIRYAWASRQIIATESPIGQLCRASGAAREKSE